MDPTEQPAASALSRCPKVPIAQLSPTLEAADEKSIEGTVCLVWPYSSSSGSFSLLLGEPDALLWRAHGRVKVVFHGRVAEQVAGAHIGIGDNVRLSLKGVEYAPGDTSFQNIAWDVHISNTVNLETHRPSQSSLTVVLITQNEQMSAQREQLPPSTPRVLTTDSDTVIPENQTWESPVFIRRASYNHIAPFDPTIFSPLEEDGSIPGKGRKRARYSFQRSDWHLSDEPCSPEPAPDWLADADQFSDQEMEESADAPDASSHVDLLGVAAHSDTEISPGEDAPTFIKPSLNATTHLPGAQAAPTEIHAGSTATSFEDRLIATKSLPTDTPKLKPIPSPGLPIPSPIVSSQHSNHGYFSPFDSVNRAQTLDSSSADSLGNAAHLGPTDRQTRFSPRENSTGLENADNEELDDQLQTNAEGPVTHHSSPLSATEVPYPDVAEYSLNGNLDFLQAGFEEPVHSHFQTSVGHDLPSFPSETHMNIPNIENVDMGDAPRHADLDVPSPEDQSSGSEATQTSQDLVGPAHPDQPQPDVGIQTMQSEEAPRHKEQEDEYYETFPHGIATLEHSTRSPDDVSSEMEPEEAASFELGQDYIDEDGVESSEAEHDDGRGDESQSENEAVSETAELPRHPPAQTEVICLDSDSEDELASNALAASRDPGMNLHHQDQNEDEYLESEEESEPAESEDDNAETFADDLHDSDKDDESSVDVLARDHYAESFWSQSSPAEQSANQEMDSEDEKSEPDNHGNVNINESASNSHAIIVLDSDEESQEQSADDMPRRGESRQSLHYDGAADVCEEEFADEDSVHEELVDEFVSEDAVDTEHQGKPGTHLEDADNEQDLPMDSSEPRQQLPIPGPTQDLENAFDSRIRKPDEGSNTSEQENSEEPPLNLASDQPEAPDDTDELASEKHDVGLLDDLEDQKMHEETGAEDNSNVDAAIVDLVPTINAPMRLLVDSTETSNVQPLKMPEVVISPLPVPDRNAHGLRSKVSYYAPLASLVDHYNALVDTISIVREVSPIAQATSSPKDYYSTLQLTDRSMAGTILQAQIFRRHPGAIPALAEGDAVLLRDFKVRSYDHSIMLVSVETSSWAVFNGSGHDPQIEGPPVEYGTEECAYAADLRKWYLESGAAMIADYELQSSIHEDSLDYLKRHASPGSPATPGSVVFSDSGSIESISHESQQEGQKRSPRDSRRRRSNRNHRRITIHELRHGRRYTEVGSPSAKESIHELRDGTLYANL